MCERGRQIVTVGVTFHAPPRATLPSFGRLTGVGGFLRCIEKAFDLTNARLQKSKPTAVNIDNTLRSIDERLWRSFPCSRGASHQ